MEKSRTELIHGLKSYLSFLRESDYIVIDSHPGKTGSASPGSRESVKKKEKELDRVARQIAQCTKCPLSRGRIHTVPGDGHPNAGLVFVGEAPGYYEDQHGKPFVGRAGKLLDKLLSGIGLSRNDVFICNVVKCRPPENRDPSQEEIDACEPYLVRQLEIIQPKVICALGRYAAQTLLRTTRGINALRGKFYHYQDIPLLSTLHPAAVLRNANRLKDVEKDFQLLADKLKENSSK